MTELIFSPESRHVTRARPLHVIKCLTANCSDFTLDFTCNSQSRIQGLNNHRELCEVTGYKYGRSVYVTVSARALCANCSGLNEPLAWCL